MKICIFGSGAVGGYFGGRLAQAGHDVTFIARGRHLDAMLDRGLQVKSIMGDFSVHPVKATSSTESIGTFDVVLCCVKSWQVMEAAKAIKPLVGPDTVVIPLQNGVEAHTTLSLTLGGEHVLPGLCKLITMVDAPGQIRHAGADPYLAFGESDGRLSQRAQTLAEAFSQSIGMTVHLSERMDAQLWRKFMLIAPWSGLGALTRAPIGVIRSLSETRGMLLDAIEEVFHTARSRGVEIEAQAIDDTMAFIDQLPPEGTASMQRDIVAGRPSELHEQSGAVVRFADESGLDVPVNRLVYFGLLPMELQARQKFS